MKTVILCGGYGTRIRDVAEDIPKPMIPIGGKPIIWHIMKTYAYYGYTNFVLCMGYKSEVIKDFFINYELRSADVTIQLGKKSEQVISEANHDEDGWRISLAETGLKSMTGARVKKIKKYIGEDSHFMLTYGDGVGDIDIDALVKFHKSHGKMVTLTGVRPPGRFGELGIDEDGTTITGFNEKPQASGGRINGGYFVCNREFLDLLSDAEDLVLEQEPMKKLVELRELKVFEHDGFWQPMDTSREYSLLNELYNNKKAPWVKWKIK
ncbi:glucose-1-phosphate cytidylyltransferase [Flavobacterium sp. LPB0248]|uniref:glucose-1-phosphate cytidylyltransferase n=1 Tax=Flavobacterium sp. LPB0248 TaxID=2614441 RepID=UPI0015A7257E|nr:glucose-1-phosphate cytidylyltransferase [Flavobacterium sp. LPB0248]QLC67477.1 glucose-1-phosphate cytidylyltransferase [Flavobacterium sp. LPB0248]